MKIPFGWLPASWGLSGTTREIAEAEYTLEGIELDDRLAEIKYRDDSKEQHVAKLKNKLKHNKITSHEYDVDLAQLTLTGVDLSERLLDIKLARKEIGQYAYDIASAQLRLSGQELDLEKLRIERKHDRITEKQYLIGVAKLTHSGQDLECELLHIEWKNGDITERDYKIGVARIMIQPGLDLDLELLEIDYELGLIEKQPYEKAVATAKGEPYICVINSEYVPEDKLDGLYFEFDWNDRWIEVLRESGYVGFTEDQIVERWFTDICRGVVQSQDQLYSADVMPFNSNRVIKKESDPNGPTTYR